MYYVQLETSGSGYVVNFQYGRRGSTLNTGTKTAAPLSYDKARKVYDALVKEKVGKGYKATEGAGSAYTPAAPDLQFTGILPQLLNAVDEEDAGDYLDDPNWVMQQKFDGHRMLVHVGGLSERIVGINRKGQAVALSQAAAAAIGRLYQPNMVLDAEAIGEKLFVFDLLEHDGKDIRGWPFAHRYQQLAATLASLTAGGPVEIVPVYSTSQEKRAAYESLREDGAEGVAFKRADSAYVPGRPASGGNALKVKFWKSASVLVSQVNVGLCAHPTRLQVHRGIRGRRFTVSVTATASSDDGPRAAR